MAKLIYRDGRIDPALASRLDARPRLLIFDFDGTLAPIAPAPGQAKLPRRVKTLLQELAEADDTRLAFVSGRALANLRAKVGLQQAVYVGNHGLSAAPSRLGVDNQLRRRWSATALQAFKLLKPLVKAFPGSRLEFKGPDLSLHYRQVSPAQVPTLLQTARRAVRGLPLAAGHGKQVLELRPRTRRNKGSAVRQLARELSPGWRRGGVCVYSGDDRTDEDAFAALRDLGSRAVGIKVGAGATLAHYRARDTREVADLISLMRRREVKVG